MRTLKELFDMMEVDKKMAKEAWAIYRDEKAVEKFLKKYDCDATVKEAREYGDNYVKETMGINDDDVMTISGGGKGSGKGDEVNYSEHRPGNPCPFCGTPLIRDPEEFGDGPDKTSVCPRGCGSWVYRD